MAFEVKGLDRKFKTEIDGVVIELSDPDPSRTPEQVMMFYANQYPSLTTATVDGPVMEGDAAVYEFKTTLGTKG